MEREQAVQKLGHLVGYFDELDDGQIDQRKGHIGSSCDSGCFGAHVAFALNVAKGECCNGEWCFRYGEEVFGEIVEVLGDRTQPHYFSSNGIDDPYGGAHWPKHPRVVVRAIYDELCPAEESAGIPVDWPVREPVLA